MRAVLPRPPTPMNTEQAADGAVVEESATSDLTEREAIPPVWHIPSGATLAPLPLPLPLPYSAVVRSRKETLVSPIPALLAAQMGDIFEDHGDSTPLPIDLRQEATSRFDISAQRALLSTADLESEYVVELVAPAKSPR